jgi:hypothetical protein
MFRTTASIETYWMTPVTRRKSGLPPGAPKLWLDGSDSKSMILSGSNVTQWNDKSGNGLNAVQPTSALQPTLSTNALNGLSVIHFPSKAMHINSVTLGPFTIFVLFRTTSDGLVYEHSVSANSNFGSYIYTTTGNTIRVNRSGGVSAKDLSSSWGSGNVWRAVAQRFDGTHAGHQLWINNVNQTLTGTGADPGLVTTTQAMYLACRNESSLFINGDIAEIILYNTVVSNLTAGFSYLSTKWAY